MQRGGASIPETFGEAAAACLANAKSLRDSALLLAQSQAYGQGCALLAISLEELGKAVAFKLCADGLGGIEGKDRRRKVVLTLPVLGKKEFALFDHPTKRGIPFWLEFLSVMVPGTIRVIGILGRAATSPERSHATPDGSAATAPPRPARRMVGETGEEASPTTFEADRCALTADVAP